jgi:hypothetical protein
MKKLLLLLLLLIIVTGCNGYQPITYQKLGIDQTVLAILPGTYALVKPNVPNDLLIKTIDASEERLGDLIGRCLQPEAQINSMSISNDQGELSQSDLKAIQLIDPGLNYVIHISSQFVGNETLPSVQTKSRNPNDLIAQATLRLFDTKNGELVYTRVMSGSTYYEDRPTHTLKNNGRGFNLVERKTGNPLAFKTIKKLLKTVIKDAVVKKKNACD